MHLRPVMLRSVIRTTLPAFALVGTLAAISPAMAQPAGLDVQSKWVFDADGVHPSGTIRGALKIVIPGKFHVQSDKPDDEFLIPTILTVTTPNGIAVAEIAYPEPILLEAEMISDQPLPVFEREFVIGVAFEVSVDLVPDTYPIGLSLGYQACDDKICLQPDSLELDSTLTVVATTTPITQTGSRLFDEIVFTGAPTPVVVALRPVAVVPTPEQDCDVVAALDRFEIMGTAGGFLGVDDFIEFIEGAETGTIQTDWFADKGPWFILGAIVLGGIALNLTPCVMPLIPINLAIIGAGAQSGSRRRGFALGGTYGIAMAAVYGVLGLIVTGVFAGLVKCCVEFFEFADETVDLGGRVTARISAAGIHGFAQLNKQRLAARTSNGHTRRGGRLGVLGHRGHLLGIFFEVLTAPERQSPESGSNPYERVHQLVTSGQFTVGHW